MLWTLLDLGCDNSYHKGKEDSYGIYVKVEIVEKLPQFPIISWKANWTFLLKKEKLILLFFGFLGVG